MRHPTAFVDMFNRGQSGSLLAHVTAQYRVGPRNRFGTRLGIGLNTLNAFTFAVTYRRFFDLALGGQLQLSAGADFDAIGLMWGITDATDSEYFNEKSEFEFGSLTAGLLGRLNLWGGEGAGGMTLGVETGFDAGRFRIVRETDEEEFEYGPGVVVQTMLGAEFYIPANPFIFNMAPEAGYRLIRPLNPEAENIHELVFGFSGMF